MSWDDNFSTLFELLPIGAYRTDARSRQVRANRAMVRIFGFDSEAEMLATSQASSEGWYVQPGRRAGSAGCWRRTARCATSSPRCAATARARPSGSARTRTWCAARRATVLYHEGTVEDITERVRAQQALQLTLDNAGRGIAQVDAEGTVVLYNRRLLELLDLPEALLAARPKMRDVIRFQDERGDFGDGNGLLDENAREILAVDTASAVIDALSTRNSAAAPAPAWSSK